jgi:hypothetical protein
MTDLDLVLEVNTLCADKTIVALRPGLTVLTTPPIGEDYWVFRVAVSDKQAILGFPKFGTIGIGFAKEEADWNTNLPWSCEAEEILSHIKENKGDDTIPDERCLAAIRLVQGAAKLRMKRPKA